MKRRTKKEITLEKKGKEVSCLVVEEVRRAMFSQNTIFISMYKEGCLVSNYNNLDLPSVFQSLLKKFEDVFQDEVSKRLSSNRGIEHKIDFISRIVISNSPTYRVNPTETKNSKAIGAHECWNKLKWVSFCLK